MKKILLGLFLVFSVVFAPSLVSAQVNPNPLLPPDCTKLTHNMKQGSTDATSGGDVTLLQDFLIANNHLQIPAATGFFGPVTKAAVIDFQDTYNIIPAIGFVGTITRTAIEWLTCGTVAPNLFVIIQNNSLLNPVVQNNNVVPANPATSANPNNNPNPNNNNPLGNNLNTLNNFGNAPLGNPNPNVNPNTSVTTLVNPNLPVVKPCLPPALFNVFTGVPCNPNVNPNPNPAVPVACTATTAPFVTVVSPNGGEKYMLNDAADIKWTSCNLPVDTVRLSLVNQTSANPVTDVIYPLVTTGDDGMETVKLAVPAGMTPFVLGTVFKIRIDFVAVSTATAGPVVGTDLSDDFFTIQ